MPVEMTTIPVDVLLDNEIYKQRLAGFTKARTEAEAAIRTAKAETEKATRAKADIAAELQKRTAEHEAAAADHVTQAAESKARIQMANAQAAEILRMENALKAREAAVVKAEAILDEKQSHHAYNVRAAAATAVEAAALKARLERAKKALQQAVELIGHA